MLPDVPRLTGRHVLLEPLRHDHVDALVAAATVDRSTYDFTLVPDDHASMREYVERLAAAGRDGSMRPFAQVLPDGRAVGCTRFMEPRWWRARAEPDEVEVGGTWLAHDVQRTPVNTEAKRLLLGHAFEVWGAWRVALCTDARNHRSRAAIERIGATFEGVLRSHRPVNALHAAVAPRDTAVFSVIAAEWPTVRGALDAMLAAA